jgi:hypothetical protein
MSAWRQRRDSPRRRCRGSGDTAYVHTWLAQALTRNLRRNQGKMEWLMLGFRVQCLALLAETVLWVIDLRT